MQEDTKTEEPFYFIEKLNNEAKRIILNTLKKAGKLVDYRPVFSHSNDFNPLHSKWMVFKGEECVLNIYYSQSLIHYRDWIDPAFGKALAEQAQNFDL